MAIRVFRVFDVCDGELIAGEPLPRSASIGYGDVCAVLTNMKAQEHGRPGWRIAITIGEGAGARQVDVPLEPFLTADEYQKSTERLVALASPLSPAWIWFFRDAIYAAERAPRPPELEEVELRIKALHYQRDAELRRLREQVANFEAIDGQLKNDPGRKPLPDDVKLLVWARDNGACVRCGAAKELHFDHIIPLARGGSDESANIQLLCRTCNLAKGDRLV